MTSQTKKFANDDETRQIFVLVCPCVPETMLAAMNPASLCDSFLKSQINSKTIFPKTLYL